MTNATHFANQILDSLDSLTEPLTLLRGAGGVIRARSMDAAGVCQEGDDVVLELALEKLRDKMRPAAERQRARATAAWNKACYRARHLGIVP